MSVSNLTNTKWLWNSEVDVYTNRSYSINFTSNNTNYTSISVIYTHEVKENWGLNYNSTEVFFDYDNVDIRWIDEAYRTIEITGGTDVTNSALISWLEANATQQATSATIVLGTNTLTDVDTIKCIDGTDNTKYNEFKYGVTPSTTTSIKVGENTLTGVNNIKVSTNTSGYAEFGYVPSGFTATISVNHLRTAEHVYYNVDNGGWTESPRNAGSVAVQVQSSIAFKMSHQIYVSNWSTGDFVNLTFTSSGGEYVTSPITMTQNSTIEFNGND